MAYEERRGGQRRKRMVSGSPTSGGENGLEFRSEWLGGRIQMANSGTYFNDS
jgi:hypothetical protein